MLQVAMLSICLARWATGSGAPQSDHGRRIIAIRADMDCLPMEETSDVPHKSRNAGKSHACGHDGHVASAVGAALLLHAKRDALPSNCVVRFLFQVLRLDAAPPLARRSLHSWHARRGLSRGRNLTLDLS